MEIDASTEAAAAVSALLASMEADASTEATAAAPVGSTHDGEKGPGGGKGGGGATRGGGGGLPPGCLPPPGACRGGKTNQGDPKMGAKALGAGAGRGPPEGPHPKIQLQAPDGGGAGGRAEGGGGAWGGSEGGGEGQTPNGSDEDGPYTTVGPSKPRHKGTPSAPSKNKYVAFIAGKSCNLAKICPIDFNRKLVAEIGAIEHAYATGYSIKVFCADEAQKNRLLYTSQIGDLEVTCSEPRDLGRLTGDSNQPRQQQGTATRGARGVIVGVWDTISEESVASETKAVKATRITKTAQGRRIRTTAMILEFDTPVLPEHVRVGYRRYKVSPYSPPVPRCYRCSDYGHRMAFCRAAVVVCPRCSGPHMIQECTATEKRCINCHEAHSAAWGGCKVYQKAKVINQQALAQGLTYAAAARRHAAVERQELKEKKAAETAIAAQQAVASVITPDPAPVRFAKRDAASGTERPPVAAAVRASAPAAATAVATAVVTCSVEVQTDPTQQETAQPQGVASKKNKKRRRRASQGTTPQMDTSSAKCSTDSDNDLPPLDSLKKVSKPTISHSSLMTFLKQLLQAVRTDGGKLDYTTMEGVQEIVTRTLGVEVTDLPKTSKSRQHSTGKTVKS